MNIPYFICKSPIPSPCGVNYKGMAFDGCYFYFTSPGRCEIEKYDCALNAIHCYTVCRGYTCICYDPEQTCFWAAAKCYNKLYQLDACFCEIDAFTLPWRDCECGAITGVSYDCSENRLLVSSASSVLSVDTTNGEDCRLLRKSGASWNTGVLALLPSYMVMELNGCGQSVAIYGGSGEEKCRFELPGGYVAEAIVRCPCGGPYGGRLPLCVLATKDGCYPYLLKYALDCRGLNVHRCNFLPCPGEGCRPPCPPDSSGACADLLESVALIETALAQILNTEGEKLEKIIASTDNVAEILCANQAVNETVVSVTHLEIILHDKLMAVQKLCAQSGCPPDCA